MPPGAPVLQQGKEDTVPFESGLRVLHVLTIVSRSAYNRMYLMADGMYCMGTGNRNPARKAREGRILFLIFIEF